MPDSLIDKIPPQNLEAEQAFLGSLLIDKDAFIKAGDSVRPDDFYQDSHRVIFETMIELFEKRSPVDILSLSNRLEEKKELKKIGGRSYLVKLTNAVPTSAHISNYAEIIRKKSTARKLVQASQEITDLAFKEEDDVTKILDKAERKLFSVSQRYLKQNFIPIKEVLSEAFERIDELHKEKGKIRGVPTGFKDLDEILAGLQKSDLVILAARPSVGKSALAIDIARQAAVNNKTPVAMFCLEMSRDQVVDRILCAQAGVNLWKMRTGYLSSSDDGDFSHLAQAMSVLSEAPIYIDDTPMLNMIEIRTKARRLQAEHGLGLIIVDYLQLLEGSSQKESRVQEVSEISRNLKAVARELQIPVLALSQLSRAVEHRGGPAIPKLADLRESGCLSGDALIMRADNGKTVAIKDLVGETGIPIYSLNENWQIEERKISKVFCSGKKMIYELKTRSGFTIKASANHPFWKTSGWTRLDELKVGDHIATPKKLKISTPENKLNDHEIILLAHLLGDGCILPNQPYHYTSADKENISVVAEAATNLFKIKPRMVKQENWWHLYLPSPYHLTHKKYHPITNWFNKLGIKRSHSWEKEIPQAIFSLENKKLALFLKHLWATDGNISKKNIKNRKPSASIYYASTSQKLVESLKYLLLRFGIRSSIREQKKENYRICYQLQIQGQEHQLSFLEKIGCFGERGKIIPKFIANLGKINKNANLDVWPKETWQFIINPIREEQGLSWRDFSTGLKTAYCGSTLFKSGIGLERMQRIASFLDSPIIAEMAEANIFWDEIISLKPLEVQQVYDATVPGLHNFIANGIIVENSIEQDSDVVMFIYRKVMDKGLANCPNELRHLAEIHVAKHRNGPTGIVKLFFDENTVSFKNLAGEIEIPEAEDDF